MKKIIYIFATLLSLTGLVTCVFFKSTYHNFDSTNVKNNIDYLSSSQFKGRLSGGNENQEVANSIEALFKEYNLKPLGKDYKEGFKVQAPIYTGGSPSLKLIKDNKVVKEFELGKDFKEDMLNFKSTNVQFNKDDKYDIYQKGIVFHKGNEQYLFSINLDKDFSFRSSFWCDGPYSFVIQINTDTFNQILDSIRNGDTIDISLPYKIEEKTIYNVAGMIKGSSSTLPPLILTAHFDHVGIDTLGNVYSGALDNASGTAFMLELAKTFSSLRLPERDIIFVALNAEEFGLLGSKDFAEKHKEDLSGGEVINFDMIGSSDYPVTFMSSVANLDKDSNLVESLNEICKIYDIKTTVSYQDSSDHVSFTNEGFDAITISHANMDNIHTPNDTVDKISEPAISKVYEMIHSKTINYAYNDLILIFYNSKTLVLFSLTTIFLLLIGLTQLKKIIINDKEVDM